MFGRFCQVGDKISVPPGIMAGRRLQIRSILQVIFQKMGSCRRGIDQGDFFAYPRLNQVFQKRIVRAAKDKSIDLLILQVVQVATKDHLCLPLVRPPFFDERDKQGTGLGKHFVLRHLFVDLLLIDVAANGRSGADNADPARPTPGYCLFNGRGDDFDDGDIELLPQTIRGHAGGGVAGYDNNLCPVLHEKSGVLNRIFRNGSRTFGAVGSPGDVAEIEKREAGQELLHSPGDGHAADT